MTKPRASATKDGSAPASAGDMEAIVAGAHGNPFAVLGVHEAPGGGLVARCFVPHAETVSAFTLDGKEAGTLARRHDGGFPIPSARCSVRWTTTTSPRVRI